MGIRKLLVFLGLAILAAPASAQLVTATLPTVCNAAQTACIRSTPVTNPDGTTVGSATTRLQPATATYTQLALTAGARAQIATPLTGMLNGIVCTAAPTNGSDVLVGGSSVTSTEDGTGNGYPIVPGGSWSEGLSTTANIYFISAAAAVISCHGN